MMARWVDLFIQSSPNKAKNKKIEKKELQLNTSYYWNYKWFFYLPVLTNSVEKEETEKRQHNI